MCDKGKGSKRLADLHQAARDGDNDTLLRLVGEGFDIDARDKHRRTPLHLAAWAGNLKGVQALIGAGCQLTAGAHDDLNALHFACTKNHQEVARALINAGVHVNSKTRKGMNALHLAASGGHTELVRFLLQRKANPHAKNKRGQTAEEIAANDEIKEALRQAAEALQNNPDDSEPAEEIGPQIGPAMPPRKNIDEKSQSAGKGKRKHRSGGEAVKSHAILDEGEEEEDDAPVREAKRKPVTLHFDDGENQDLDS